MRFGQARELASPADHPDRRLIGGLLVSLLLHGVVLLLQFGVPGLGLPGAPPPLTVHLAAVPIPAPAPVPLPETDVAAPAPPPAPPRQIAGMQVLDPVAAPPPPPPKAAPELKKDKPRRAKRISSPLPSPDTVADAARVISQDNTVNDFKVPVARPEESEQKTVDLKDAQHGEDDGDASTSAALEAAAAKAGKLKAEEDARAAKLAREAEQHAAQEQQAAQAEQNKVDEARRRAEQVQQGEQEAARLHEQQLAQQKAEQQKLEQQKAEQLRVEQKKTDQQAAEKQRAEQLKLEQQKTEQARLAQQKQEQQKAEQVKLEQQQAEQLKLERQKAEQFKLEQQQAEQAKLAQQKAEQQRAEQQMAEQKKVEQQKAEQQRAEQQKAEQQKAEQQKAEQQRAEQQRAAEQRGKDLAAAQPGVTGQGGPAGGAGTGAGGGTGQIPKNMLGSDLGNRARDLVKGLDVLRGAPPVARRPGDRRIAVGFNERDLSLKMYVDSWRQKIERNGALNYPRSWADAVKVDPLVSVAVRSDGSVEDDVVIVQSSGRADMDEAVRRIVRVNARYSPFPPQIAERYDVIVIRRVWHFDDTLKLMEEVH